LGLSLAQWTPSIATRGRATTFEIKKNKTKKKPNVRFNILDVGYPLDDESIA
jgi:hypothetical protein